MMNINIKWSKFKYTVLLYKVIYMLIFLNFNSINKSNFLSICKINKNKKQLITSNLV